MIRSAAWLELASLSGHKEKEKLQLLRQVRKDRKWLLTANEAFLLQSLAKAQSGRPGAMAEIGVFQGGSAKVLCEAKGRTPLHLFDTFTGLPEATVHDALSHRTRANMYACSLESVQTYLEGYPDVFFHKGFFPDSAADLDQDLVFSFVHCDVDLYESTLQCLKFFYPRMIPGGIILSHDYSILAGVRKAFAEFLDDKPERLIELPTTQCMLIKLQEGGKEAELPS